MALSLWPTRPPAPGRMLALPDIALHVEERGATRTAPSQGTDGIVLLHGYLAAAHVWRAVMDELGQEAAPRLVALDLPGSGYSERPANFDYSLPGLARTVVTACQALGLKRPLLVGHSLGGGVALHAATLAPERVAGLVLVSPLCYPTPVPRILRPASHWPGLFQWLFRTPVGRLTVRPALRRNFAALPAREGAAALDLTLAHLDAPGGWMAATALGMAAAWREPMEPLLPLVRCPALVVWGGHDRVHPVPFAQRLCIDLADAEAAVFNSCAHNPHLEDPRRFVDELRRWLARRAVV